MSSDFKIVAVIAATTLGAGMFGLPYVFLRSGWLTGIFYLFVLSFIVAGSQILYWRSLAVADEKRLLIGMARDFLGGFWYRVGIFAVIAGLTLALVIYLILGTSFIRLFWPSIDANLGLFLFWLAGIMPLFFEKRVLGMELAGIFFMVAIIFFVLLTAPQFAPQVIVPAMDLSNFFLPFGVVIFSLAGWTAIEPLFRERKEKGDTRVPVKPLLAGTLLTSVLYVVFVYGIFSSTAEIAPDTISGLSGWPLWKLAPLGILGIFALWTSYMPIGLEIKNSFVRDLGWRRSHSLAFAVIVPPLLVIFGLRNFLDVIGLAGGAFLSLQYILMVLVGKRVLKLGKAENLFFNFVVAAFLLAAAYEGYYFAVS